MAEPRSPDSTRLDSTRPLDGVRGIAALMVFVTHLGGIGYYPWIIGFGQLGVALFFVLSGFLMGMLYMERTVSVRYWFRYAIRRVFRVYPMFALFVFFAFLVFDPLGQKWGVPIKAADLLDHLTLRAGVMHLWTIPVEMKFYACFPFIAFGVASVASRQTRGLVIAGLLVAFMFLVPEGEVLSVWQYIDVFLLGVLAAHFHLQAGSDEAGAAMWRRAMWNGAVVVSFLCLVLLIPSVSKALIGTSFSPFRDTWVTGIPCFALIVAATRCSGWVRAFLVSRVARFFGAVSYSLYLTHGLVIRGVDRKLESAASIEIAVIVILTLLVAWACYRLIETPFRDLGRRLAASVPPMKPSP